MQDDRTYIKVFRQMLKWGWYGDTNTFRVFMHILLRANYEPSEYLGHTIGAGSCVFGRKKWAKELGLSERQVRTAISHLQATNEIAIKTTNKFSIITVVKWEFWQIEEGGTTTKSTNKKSNERPTSDQQATTSKESKNTTTKYKHSMGHPKLEDVRAYVTEKKLIIDPDYFFDYYETAGWVDNKGKPIQNWKLKALNWNKREEERNGERVGQVNDRGTEQKGRGISGATDGSGSGVRTGRVTFPRANFSLQEEDECEDRS